MNQQTIIIPEKINDLKNKLKESGTGWEDIINPYKMAPDLHHK